MRKEEKTQAVASGAIGKVSQKKWAPKKKRGGGRERAIGCS